MRNVIMNANLNDTRVDLQDRKVVGINGLRVHLLHQRARLCAYTPPFKAEPSKAKSAGGTAAPIMGTGSEAGSWPRWLTLTLAG